MKKPNITGGKWEAAEYNQAPYVQLIIETDDTVIAEMDSGITDYDEVKANAKAISAVPVMIDALLEANDYIIENAPDDIYPEPLLNKIEQALIKAGCK